MWIFAMLLSILAIFSMYDRTNENGAQQQQNEAATIAYQLGYWQHQAEKACPKAGSCPNGPINVPPPPVPTGSTWLYGKDFQSHTDGSTFVITHWIPGNNVYTGVGAYSSTNRLYGPIASVLSTASGKSLFVGQWLASTQTISRSESYSESGYDQIPGNSIVIPQGFGGATLTDKEPLAVMSLQN